MIPEILTTDMAIRDKILNNIRPKIPEYLLQRDNHCLSDKKNEKLNQKEKEILLSKIYQKEKYHDY